MSNQGNRRVVLVERPVGMPGHEHLRLETGPRPQPGPGQMLLRTVYLSLDPYMRGRMNAGPSYAASQPLGEVMTGRTVSEVVESNLAGFEPGEFVLCEMGWQEYAVSDGTGLMRKLDPEFAPLTTAHGVLGGSGHAAYVGLLDFGRPRPGETVVVSAASGAVGQVVGQLAKLHGCRAVGIAGSDAKCRYVVEELGFDAAVNYRADAFLEQFDAACPHGIDVYFENVGGQVLEAALARMNEFGRIPVCGMISYYNLSGVSPEDHDKLPLLMRAILTRKLSLRGYIRSDHLDREPAFLRDMGEWYRSGKIQYREDIVEGLENAVDAFQGLLSGRNFGKLMVQVGADPTRD